ncbi:serine/threonine protein kinase [Skermanella aerolata]|uniref:serine/threonine-protein kinase n=1 Tax=Skermanella aerolata TaxID=393310 RepID=UPI003D21F689
MIGQGNDNPTHFIDAERRSGSGPAEKEPTISPGTVLNHTHRIEKLVGGGGMGEVYRAHNEVTGQEHAIKIIRYEHANDSRMVELFRREAEILRMIRNDAIVAYEGLFRDERSRLYLVMEFVDGPSLADFITQRPLTVDEVRRLRRRISGGLVAAHDRGVFHRDVSTDNIILPGGRLEDAKIIDFGIAKFADPTVTTMIGSDFAGKLSWVSPEQLGLFGGKIDARSDIYSLGLVLAAAAIGRPLDMGLSMADVMEARRRMLDLSQVPEELRGEISCMLMPDPAARPQSVREFLADPIDEQRSPPHRSRWITLIGLFLLLTGGSGGYYYYHHNRESGQSDWVEIPPPPEIDTAKFQQAVNDVLKTFGCSRLSVGYSRVSGNQVSVSLSGFVSSEADRQQLQQRIASLGYIGEVTVGEVTADAVSVHVWPMCETLLVLEGSATLGAQGAPLIELSHQDGIYREGDFLILNVRMSSRFDGYLNVAFLDAEGSVVHLFPTPRRQENHIKAGGTVVLGTRADQAKPGERYYPVESPFGRNMVIALATPRPLFTQPRSELEPAGPFLEQLRLALATAGENVFATYTFLTTQAADVQPLGVQGAATTNK